MKIQQSSLQGAGITRNTKLNNQNKPADPKDTVQLTGKSGLDPSLASLSSKGVSREFAAKILTKGNKIDPTPLDQVPKVFNKSRKWSSTAMRGTFSTGMIYSQKDDCYYTGMLGKGKTDIQEGRKYLTALNTDGSVKWTYDKVSITANPSVDDKGNIYLRSQHALTAIDKDGKELWTCKAEGSSRSQVREELHQRWYSNTEYEDHAPQIGPDGTAYILATKNGDPYDGGGVTAIKDGKVLWQSETNPSGDLGPSFQVKNGNVYISKIIKKERRKGIFRKKETVQMDVLSCMNPDGTEKFKINLSDFYQGGWSNPEEARRFSVADDGSVFIMNGSDKFTKYSADGEKLWDYEVKPFNSKGNENLWVQVAPIPTKDGKVLLSTAQRKISGMDWKSNIVEIDENGKETWHKEFKTFITSQPKLAENGDIFFTTNDNKMTDGLVQLNKSGHMLNKFTFERGHEDIHGIQSVNFGPKGNIAVETLHSNGYGTWNHKREISVISTDRETSSAFTENGTPGNETGTIETTEKFVVINGVKVPLNRKG